MINKRDFKEELKGINIPFQGLHSAKSSTVWIPCTPTAIYAKKLDANKPVICTCFNVKTGEFESLYYFEHGERYYPIDKVKPHTCNSYHELLSYVANIYFNEIE